MTVIYEQIVSDKKLTFYIEKTFSSI